MNTGHGGVPPETKATTLAASQVSTWDWDVLADRIRFDPDMARLFGFSEGEGRAGVPMARFASVFHPDDRVRIAEPRRSILERGGLFIVEHRIVPAPGVVRWVLARGRCRQDGTGRVAHGCGIAVDVTDLRTGASADDPLLIVREDDTGSAALDGVIGHVLAARNGLDGLDGEIRARLKPLADALLFELGCLLAASLGDPSAEESEACVHWLFPGMGR